MADHEPNTKEDPKSEIPLHDLLDRREGALPLSRLLTSLAAFYRWIDSDSRRELWLLLALMVAVSFLEAATIASLLPFLDLAAGEEGLAARWAEKLGLSAGESVLSAAALVGILAIASAAAQLVLVWRTQRFIHHVGHVLAVEVYERMLRQPYELFIRRNSSEVLGGMEKVQGLVLGVFQPTLQGISALAISIFILAALLAIAPLVTLVAGAFIGLIYGAITIATRGRLRRISDELSQTYVARIKILQEGLGGIRDIIIDRTAPTFLHHFRDNDRRFRAAQVQSNVISAAPKAVVEGIGLLAIAITAAIISLQAGGLVAALPMLGVFALAALRMLPLLQRIYTMRTAFLAYSGLLADVMRLVRVPVRADAPDSAMDRAAVPFKREVRFDEVSFAYGGSSMPALDAVSLRIGKGERIGIMGPSGSGKSTLLDLFLGLIDPTSGRLLVDGRELNHGGTAMWQAAIGHVPQAIYLLDASIADNVAFGIDPALRDDQRIGEALRGAGLEQFVRSLPEGRDTVIGERGAALSGGQRQRIGLARALYKQAAILVLDEATSALDVNTEGEVLASIERVGRDLTVLCVAHRRSSLRLCDRIYHLEEGRIASVERLREGAC